MDLLLFYQEHFMDFWKVIYQNAEQQKNVHFTKNISVYMGHRHFEVL